MRIEPPLKYWVLPAFAILMASALAVFFFFGHISRKSTATGLLMLADPAMNVSAPQFGVISNCRVKEGQIVRAGDVLFVLDMERAGPNGGVATLVARQLTLRKESLVAEGGYRELQARQHQDALRGRIKSTEAELRQQGDEISSQERRQQLAQITLERHQQLARDHFVSQAQVQQRQEELLDITGRLQNLQRGRVGLLRDLQGLKTEVVQIQSQLDTELSQLRRNLASIDQEAAENESRRQQLVTAPGDAIVASLQFRAGQAVQAGQTLATLVPTAPSGGSTNQLQAHLYIPSQKSGFIEAGQRVYLRYSAFPFQKFGMFGGTVAAVTYTPLTPVELPPGLSAQLMSQAQSNEALYRVTVIPDQQAITVYGHLQRLRPGMTVEADVMHESRAIWEWVFEPVLAARSKARVLSGSSISSGWMIS